MRCAAGGSVGGGADIAASVNASVDVCGGGAGSVLVASGGGAPRGGPPTGWLSGTAAELSAASFTALDNAAKFDESTAINDARRFGLPLAFLPAPLPLVLLLSAPLVRACDVLSPPWLAVVKLRPDSPSMEKSILEALR